MNDIEWSQADIEGWVRELVNTEYGDDFIRRLVKDWSIDYLNDQKIKDHTLAYLAVAGVVDKVLELYGENASDVESALEALYKYVGHEEGYNLNINQFQLEYEYVEVTCIDARKLEDRDMCRRVGNYDEPCSIIVLDSGWFDQPSDEDIPVFVCYMEMLNLGLHGNDPYKSEPLHERLMEKVPGFSERYEQIYLSNNVQEVATTKRMKL